jgi:hypothetical protein
MTFGLRKTSRLPRWPVWAVGVVLAWLALVGATEWLAWRVHQPFELCLLKRLTGLPCPTCGLTRGILALLHGRLTDAIAFNPLAFVILGVAAIGLLGRLALGVGLRLDLSRGERKVAGILAVALLLSNWVYLIVCVG